MSSLLLFVDHEVTWLEATIASPVFTGLVTYYIEGAQEHRHHLMEETITQPQRAYGVRGSLFSFLLPWEQIQRDVRRTVMEGDLSEWPLSPAQVGRVLRVRFMKGPVEIINKFKELSVRAKVLKDVAHMFISNHCKDLVDRPGVLSRGTLPKFSDFANWVANSAMFFPVRSISEIFFRNI